MSNLEFMKRRSGCRSELRPIKELKKRDHLRSMALREKGNCIYCDSKGFPSTHDLTSCRKFVRYVKTGFNKVDAGVTNRPKKMDK